MISISAHHFETNPRIAGRKFIRMMHRICLLYIQSKKSLCETAFIFEEATVPFNFFVDERMTKIMSHRASVLPYKNIFKKLLLSVSEGNMDSCHHVVGEGILLNCVHGEKKHGLPKKA